WGQPQGLTFSPDRQHLLVATIAATGGAIASVRADGVIEATPVVRSAQLVPAGIAYAPDKFGSYGGQLFIASGEPGARDTPMTYAPPAAGRVYRLTREGELKLVASGLRGPQGVHFVGNRLWVSDVNGDFIAGHRELPDGFVVEITPLQGTY